MIRTVARFTAQDCDEDEDEDETCDECGETIPGQR